MQLCYWLIGTKQATFPVAMAFDVHGADAELLCETRTKPWGERRAHAVMARWQRCFGIECTFDADSTEFFAEC